MNRCETFIVLLKIGKLVRRLKVILAGIQDLQICYNIQYYIKLNRTNLCAYYEHQNILKSKKI